MNRSLTLAIAAVAVVHPLIACAESTSWVFLPGAYTHDPATGARVAQYQPVAPVEPLPDPRLVTSGFRRTRTSLLGPNGTVDTSFQVQSFANGRGGIDAEWERVAEEWRASFLTGSAFAQQNGFGTPGFVQPGFGQPGFVQPGFGVPGFIGPGFPAAGFNPAFANPAFANGFGFGGFQPGAFGGPGVFTPGFNNPAFANPNFQRRGFRGQANPQRRSSGSGTR